MTPLPKQYTSYITVSVMSKTRSLSRDNVLLKRVTSRSGYKENYIIIERNTQKDAILLHIPNLPRLSDDFVLSFHPVCPAVMPVHNGHARGNGTTVGSRYWFTCNKGFTMIGPDSIQCGEDGHWNGTLPKCAKGKGKTNVAAI